MKKFNKKTIIYYLLVGLLFVSGCGDSKELTEIDNTVRISKFTETGTGIYLGKGIVLTNWHICINSATFDFETEGALELSHYLRTYNRGEDGNNTFDLEPSLDGYYCWTTDDSGSMEVNVQEERVTDDCTAIKNRKAFIFSSIGETHDFIDPSQILYANMELDLCAVELKLSDEDFESIDNRLHTISIATKEVFEGQKVVLAGHPAGSRKMVVESCEVISTVEEEADPDTVHPSELVVPSFKIDCKSAKPGSSGSPVFDAETKQILGLLWTGENTDDGRVSPAYVSAARAWMDLLDSGDNRTEHSQLARIIDSYAASEL